jgi:hypothetical protein
LGRKWDWTPRMLAGFNEQSTCGTSARLGRGPRMQLPARGRAARRRRTAGCRCFWRGKRRFGPEIVAMLLQGAKGLADLPLGLPVLKMPTGPKRQYDSNVQPTSRYPKCTRISKTDRLSPDGRP